ncbi:MAG TPA: phospholipase D family protein [Rhodanobacteraceae bacterium]|nr:phospholipase D family protein [Rhodanobacteraceae bacterium]
MARFAARMLRVAASLLLPALAGCALSRAEVRQANHVVSMAQQRNATPNCDRADHCAAPSALLALGRAAAAASTPQAPQHRLILIDSGENALAARLNLIAAARHSIDVQTYIWARDDVGNLMLDELLKAAHRGVQVRILADQLFSFENVDMLAALARSSPDLQIRLYNPTFNEATTQPLQFAAGIVCCFFKINQRMHDKLMLVDGQVGIVGGRNYQDRYFGWDPDLDYVDREVLVAGPAAQQMQASFDVFWAQPRAVPLTRLTDVNRALRKDGADAPGWAPPAWVDPERITLVEGDAANAQWIGAHLLAHVFDVGRVDYYSDLPQKTDDPTRRADKTMTVHLTDMVGDAHHTLVMQTPYLLFSDKAFDLLKRLHRTRPGLHIVVSTNSLAATDDFAVYALSYKHRKRYIKRLGLEIYELKPHPVDALGALTPATTGLQADGTAADAGNTAATPAAVQPQPVPITTPGVRIALHAKSYVIDGRIAMVGSHNFDPRSDHYNTENGVIVDDPAFALAVQASILRTTAPGNAWVVARTPSVPLFGPVSRVLGDISAALPIFDLWPFRYASDWQKKPGCPPLRPDDPKFRQCYENVGDFPEVELSTKAIYTRIFTAFGVGLSGIM